MPYFLIGAESIYDRLCKPRFHLVVFGGDEDETEALKAGLAEPYERFVDVTVIPLTRKVAEIFGATAPFTVLLRPDNHLQLIWPETAADGLRRCLNRVFKDTPAAPVKAGGL
jgi:hypothetical protein